MMSQIIQQLNALNKVRSSTAAANTPANTPGSFATSTLGLNIAASATAFPIGPVTTPGKQRLYAKQHSRKSKHHCKPHSKPQGCLCACSCSRCHARLCSRCGETHCMLPKAINNTTAGARQRTSLAVITIRAIAFAVSDLAV